MFGSRKTTVINTTTVDNNVYLDNDIQNQVDVVAEFSPTFANAVSVDTAPIAEAVAGAVAPIERMGKAVADAMAENVRIGAESQNLQAQGMAATAAALQSLGAGLSKLAGDEPKGEGLSGVASSVESLTKIAAGVLTLAAVYFLFTTGRLPDIEVSA